MSAIKTLVDRGLELRSLIARARVELDDIEERLTKIGLAAEHEPLADAGREGRRWFARGSQLMIPVIFTSDKLIRSVGDNTPLHRRILEQSGDKFQAFFRPVKKWDNLFTDGKQFRAAAREQFGEIKGPSFVGACLARDKDNVPKSDIKIEWDAAEVLG